MKRVKIRTDVFGWFDDANQTAPAHDPGPSGLCPVCCWPVQQHSIDNPLVTISVMLEDPTKRNRSYFFRAHKRCWDRQTEYQQKLIESSIIDKEHERLEVCQTCNGTRQIQTTEWPVMYDTCSDCVSEPITPEEMTRRIIDSEEAESQTIKEIISNNQ